MRAPAIFVEGAMSYPPRGRTGRMIPARCGLCQSNVAAESWPLIVVEQLVFIVVVPAQGAGGEEPVAPEKQLARSLPLAYSDLRLILFGPSSL